MKFYHSGQKITEINKTGRFGSFLFFLPENDCSYGDVSYSINIEDSEIASYDDIKSAMYDDDYQKILPIIKEAMMAFEVDEDEASEILTGENENFIGDENALMQVFQGSCAVALGFKGLKIEDEFSGETIMIDMYNRINELKEV